MNTITMDYQYIKDFINQQIDRRERSNGAGLHTPSKYWQDFSKLAGYVRRLQDEDLRYIRYHTWHLTADSYMGYYFFPERIPGLVEEYLNILGTLEGFKPSESERGLGYDTEYGKLSVDLLRYMRVLSDLYAAGKISRNGDLSVLEIGGGYGQLARLFLSFNPATSYILCDLEETLFFQAVYLTNELGADRVKFLTGYEPNDFKLAAGNVYLLPQSLAHIAEKFKFDVAVNQQSMQEMTQDQVDNYCDLIKKTCKYFYSCNLDQHIEFIVNRTEIIRGLNEYLASKFTVEWSSKPLLTIPTAPCVEIENTAKSNCLSTRVIRRLRAILAPAPVVEKPPEKPEDPGTIYGDYRVPRMVMKV